MTTPEGISRRAFLQTAAGAAALGGLAGLGLLKSAPPARANPFGQTPLVWVWKFSVDGPLRPIRDRLAHYGLGMLLKTHDGTSWMSRFDPVPDAITGPARLAAVAAYCEEAGVPFHAWFVVKGEDPITEARMCAQALDAGARSMFIDLEPPEGPHYWQGTPDSALRFGQELRRLQPNAQLIVAPDLRPWQAPKIPLAEFMSFSDGVAPQSYWETFNGRTNQRYLREHGYSVGPEGFTPELAVDVAVGTFRHFGRPIYPIGEGAATPDKWQRFLNASTARGLQPVSLWRYGTASGGAFGVLRDSVPPLVQAPAQPDPGPATAAGQASEDDYTVDSVQRAATFTEPHTGLPEFSGLRWPNVRSLAQAGDFPGASRPSGSYLLNWVRELLGR